MLIVEPVFTVEALNHVGVDQLSLVRLFAHAVNVKEGHVVLVFPITVRLPLESGLLLSY